MSYELAYLIWRIVVVICLLILLLCAISLLVIMVNIAIITPYKNWRYKRQFVSKREGRWIIILRSKRKGP